jgi:hypothetical protein
MTNFGHLGIWISFDIRHSSFRACVYIPPQTGIPVENPRFLIHNGRAAAQYHWRGKISSLGHLSHVGIIR